MDQSILKKGLSYTELEYDYAVESGKPVIRLLHKDPFNKLQGQSIENSDIGRKRLADFREKLGKSSLVRFWEDPKELGAEVVYGIMDARKRRPATGWVRADGLATQEAELEIAELRRKLAEMELREERSRVSSNHTSPHVMYISRIAKDVDAAIIKCLGDNPSRRPIPSLLDEIKRAIITWRTDPAILVDPRHFEGTLAEGLQRLLGTPDDYNKEKATHIYDILKILGIMHEDGVEGVHFNTWASYCRSSKYLESID